MMQPMTDLAGKSSGSRLAGPHIFHGRMVKRRTRLDCVDTRVRRTRDHSHSGIVFRCVRMCPHSDMATRRMGLFLLGTSCPCNLEV